MYFIKFSDDTALLSLLSNDEVGHGPVVNDFVPERTKNQRHVHWF